MKKTRLLCSSAFMASIAAAMAPLAAAAFDTTPDASRILSDPEFLTSKGQIYGNTSYTYGDTSADVNNASGIQTKTYTTITNTITQTLAYGVTDDFSLSVADSYEWSKTNNDLSSGNTTANRSDGFNDPFFRATWRVIDQKNAPFDLDLIAGYSPDWLDKDTGTVTEDGSVARGGQAAYGTIGIGYKTKDFTIRGFGTAEWYGDRNTLNITNNETSTAASYWQYQFGFETQTRLTNRISFNAGVTETFNNSYSSTNQTTLATSTTSQGDSTNFNAALNLALVPNRVVLSGTYQYILYQNGSTAAANPANSTSTNNKNENIFGAQLQYLFN